ncbi:hypothetical protein ACHWQZ_G006363 [Mnemiopsis leidyi]
MSSQANSFFTCFLACCKVLILKYPLKAKTWTSKGLHTSCAFIWTAANIYPILRFILDTDGLVFSYISYNANFGLSSNSSNAIRITAYTFSILTKDILTLAILIATCYIMLYLRRSRHAARKSGGSVRWQGICTVFVTSTVYCSTVVLNRIGYYSAITVKSRGYRESQFNRATEILSTVNIMSNFYIYCLTVPSFRTFIRTKTVELFSRFGGLSHITGRQKEQVELCQNVCSQRECSPHLSVSPCFIRRLCPRTVLLNQGCTCTTGAVFTAQEHQQVLRGTVFSTPPLYTTVLLVLVLKARCGVGETGSCQPCPENTCMSRILKIRYSCVAV